MTYSRNYESDNIHHRENFSDYTMMTKPKFCWVVAFTHHLLVKVFSVRNKHLPVIYDHDLDQF